MDQKEVPKKSNTLFIITVILTLIALAIPITLTIAFVQPIASAEINLTSSSDSPVIELTATLNQVSFYNGTTSSGPQVWTLDWKDLPGIPSDSKCVSNLGWINALLAIGVVSSYFFELSMIFCCVLTYYDAKFKKDSHCQKFLIIIIVSFAISIMFGAIPLSNWENYCIDDWNTALKKFVVVTKADTTTACNIAIFTCAIIGIPVAIASCIFCVIVTPRCCESENTKPASPVPVPTSSDTSELKLSQLIVTSA